MKRIAAGYYTETYKGQVIEVVKRVNEDNNNEFSWMNEINGECSGDPYTTKALALQAAKYVVDHPEEYAYKSL